MAKIRLQGKKSELKRLIKRLSHIPFLEVTDVSEPYLNTDKKTYRIYGSMELKQKERRNKS